MICTHTHTHIYIINYELIIHKKYIKTTPHIYILHFRDVLSLILCAHSKYFLNNVHDFYHYNIFIIINLRII